VTSATHLVIDVVRGPCLVGLAEQTPAKLDHPATVAYSPGPREYIMFLSFGTTRSNGAQHSGNTPALSCETSGTSGGRYCVYK